MAVSDGAASAQRGQENLKVFISYSRKDGDFAEDLVAALEACGFTPYLDRHDVAPGEPWEERLERLILEADTVVFVLSPNSVASERCEWELEKTEQLGKRILPVVQRTVPEETVPQRLRRLNYIFFSEGHHFGAGLRSLARTLNTDLDWIREHTRLGETAARWHARGRPEELLLRGHDIEEARRWLANRPREAPEPSDLQRAYILESEKQDREARARQAAQEAALKDAELTREKLAREKAEDAAKAAQALTEATRRTARRTLLGLLATLALFTVAALLGWQVVAQNWKAAAQRAATEIERTIVSESLAETSRALLESGNTEKALQSADEALRLSRALAAKLPGDYGQQRDLAISYLRRGDVLRACIEETRHWRPIRLPVTFKRVCLVMIIRRKPKP
jgi:hypothetical protein